MVNVGERRLRNKGDNVYTQAVMAAVACGIVQAVYSVCCMIIGIMAIEFHFFNPNRTILHFCLPCTIYFHLFLSKVPFLSMLNFRILKCEMKHLVHVVMTTCVDGKKRPEEICRGVGRFLPFLTWFPFTLARLPLAALVSSALAYCTLPTYCYMYKHLVVMFSCSLDLALSTGRSSSCGLSV